MQRIETGDINWAARYEDFAEFARHFVSDIAETVIARISEQPERGGLAIRRKGFLRSQLLFWDQKRDFVSLVGAFESECMEITWLTDIEMLYCTWRMRNKSGEPMFPEAKTEFRDWAREFTSLHYWSYEVAAGAREKEYFALYCEQWKFRQLCAIFTRKSWVLVRNDKLPAAVQFPGYSVSGQWIVDHRTFEELFERELELLAHDDERCLPVLSCLMFPSDGLEIDCMMRKEGGAHAGAAV